MNDEERSVMIEATKRIQELKKYKRLWEELKERLKEVKALETCKVWTPAHEEFLVLMEAMEDR